MKLQPDRSDTQSINAYGPGWLAVNGKKFEHSLVVGAQGELFDWNCPRFDALTAAHFEALLPSAPELVLFGSGARLRFAAPVLLRALIDKGIGVECMDTAAACRTYNILAGEGRKVLAALIMETA